MNKQANLIEYQTTETEEGDTVYSFYPDNFHIYLKKFKYHKAGDPLEFGIVDTQSGNLVLGKVDKAGLAIEEVKLLLTSPGDVLTLNTTLTLMFPFYGSLQPIVDQEYAH